MKSVILIPVPNADPVINEWRKKYDSALKGIPAHITLLYPFKPPNKIETEDIKVLKDFFKKIEHFEFQLCQPNSFPTVLFLEPHPKEIFVNLTKQLVQIFPDYLPYEGKFSSVNPHATIANLSDEKNLKRIKPAIISGLSKKLPIMQKVTEAWLMIEKEDGYWEIKEKFSFQKQV